MMTKRMKELAIEAKIRSAILLNQYGNHDALTDSEQEDLKQLEKFAELIVRECGYHADVFESLGCPVDMDPTETKPSDYIKKHFGVED